MEALAPMINLFPYDAPGARVVVIWFCGDTHKIQRFRKGLFD